MADLYGLRTRDAAGAVTLDTTVTPVRSLKTLTVTGNGAWDQYFTLPEIKAESFVVVDARYDGGKYTSTPDAWWSNGSLHLRRAYSGTWTVMVLSQGGEPFSAVGSYGIRVKNNNVKMQLDSVNKSLSVHSSGSLVVGYDKPSRNFIEYADSYFSSVITTQERPLVFLNADDYMMVGNFTIFGSPGAWTGFRVYAWPSLPTHGEAANAFMNIKWFCATYGAAALPQPYGARVADEVGARLFTTNSNIVTLNNQPSDNSFVQAGPAIAGPTYYHPSQQMPWTGNYSDYVLANALFSCSNIGQTEQPFRDNFGGFWPGNRSILQMYCYNASGINPLSANGRTVFAARPMKSL